MRLGCVLVLAVFGTIASAQKAPDEARQALVVHEGLEAVTFAAEPMFANPCDMDIDARGRVWITEGWNYRASKLRPEGDRIQVLEDSDGDGRADKATTFYQGNEINSALGICVLGDKVLVSCAPSVLLFEDKDGDLKADGKPRVIFSGIAGVQHDHSIHAFVFGPDGKLYFNFGNAGGQLKTADGKPVIDKAGNDVTDKGKPYRQGIVFRCDWDPANPEVMTKTVETLAWNFRNNYEVAVDSFGTMWQSDNDDDGNRGVRINYVMEFGNYGFVHEASGAGWMQAWEKAKAKGASEDLRPYYHWHQFDPGVVPNLLQTGAGSPTGICVYEGKVLPPAFHGQMIHCEPGANVVRAYPVQTDGAGYKATILELASSKADKWFRPSDVTVAPDGSVFVCDWYDPGVGGHATGDKPAEKVRGRVYRIAPKGTRYDVPKVDLSSAAGAVAALASPNMATRYLAWRKLHEVGADGESELAKLWAGADTRMRARALYLLARVQGSQERYVKLAISDKDADIRIVGLRLARQHEMDLVPLVKQLAGDESPQVRRECAIALRGNKSSDAARLWSRLAAKHDGRDRWYLEALGIGAAGNDAAYFEAFVGMQQLRSDKPSPSIADPGFRDIVWRLRSDGALPYLARIISDPGTSPAEREKFFRSFDFLQGPQRDDTLVALVESTNDKTIAIEALSRLRNLPPEKTARVKGRIAAVLDSAKGSAEFVQLVEQFDLKDRSQDLLAFVIARPTDAAAGNAIRLVLKHDPKALERGLAGENAAKIAAALAASTDRQVIQSLERIAAEPRRDLSLRQAAVSALSKSRPGQETLLKLAREKKLGDDVRPLAASLLHNSSSQTIRTEAAKVIPVPTAKGSDQLPPISKLMTMKGDPAKGKAVFVSATCATCHVVNGEGTEYGPNLSEIGTKLSKEALYQSILYPNAGISFGYEGWILDLGDGETLDGMITSETANELVLRRAGGINTPVKKSAVKDRRKMSVSIMPEGLQQQTTPGELVDLVEYLATLTKKG
jgi:putative membrane-bound dehydrogenase-like protein